MTCIVGLCHGGKVYLGGDSAATGGTSQTIRTAPKVFKNGEFLMGFTSSFRMGQLLEHAFNPPRCHPDTPVMQYMVTEFVDGVRDCLKRGGYAETSNGVDTGGVFLVGHRGRLFQIESDFQVGESAEGFDAVGCGQDLALGSLFSSTGAPEARVTLALEAAQRFSAGVQGPFHVIGN